MATQKIFKQKAKSKQTSVTVKEEVERTYLFTRISSYNDEFLESELRSFSSEGNQQRQRFIGKLLEQNPKFIKSYINAYLAQQKRYKNPKNSEVFYDIFAEQYLPGSDIESEETKREMLEELDYGDGDIFDEDEGEIAVETEVTRLKPRWWVKGRIVQEEKPISARFWKLYTKPGCPFCVKAEQLLKDRSEEYVKINITAESLEKLKPKIGDHNTVPIVFLDDKFIGGSTELEEKLRELPIKQKGKIYEGIEGSIEAPIALTGEISRSAPPVKKRVGLGFDPACFNKQVSAPWIEGKVESVWVGPAPGEEMNMGYVIADKSIVNTSDVTFYKAGRSFYELQCNYYSHKRRQNEFVLTSYDINDKPVRFMVLYEISSYKDSEWVYQDEAIFNKQVEYLRGSSFYSSSVLLGIRAERVSDSVRYAGKLLLENVLNDVMDVDYVKDYSNRLENYIYSTYDSIESYFSAIISITVFLESWNNSIFKERVRSRFYQPEILGTLSINEKLPEVFDNPNITSEKREEMSMYVDTLIKNQVNDLIKRIAQIRQPGVNRSQKTYASLIAVPRIDTSNVPDCVSELLGKGTKDVNIVYYTDVDGKTYCFDAFELKIRFENGEYNNLDSGNNFSDDFINKVLHFDQYVDTTSEEIPISDIPKEVKIMAPGLREKIIEDIKRMEDNMVQDAQSIVPAVESLKDQTQDTLDLCGYCQKHIEKNTGYKTMINRNNSYEMVRFCNEKCFEKIDEWEAGNEPDSLDVPGQSPIDPGEDIVKVIRTNRDKPGTGETEGAEYQITSWKKRKDVSGDEVIVE